jgi:hypothetical protein
MYLSIFFILSLQSIYLYIGKLTGLPIDLEASSEEEDPHNYGKFDTSSDE